MLPTQPPPSTLSQEAAFLLLCWLWRCSRGLLYKFAISELLLRKGMRMRKRKLWLLSALHSPSMPVLLLATSSSSYRIYRISGGRSEQFFFFYFLALIPGQDDDSESDDSPFESNNNHHHHRLYIHFVLIHPPPLHSSLHAWRDKSPANSSPTNERTTDGGGLIVVCERDAQISLSGSCIRMMMVLCSACSQSPVPVFVCAAVSLCWSQYHLGCSWLSVCILP